MVDTNVPTRVLTVLAKGAPTTMADLARLGISPSPVAQEAVVNAPFLVGVRAGCLAMGGGAVPRAVTVGIACL